MRKLIATAALMMLCACAPEAQQTRCDFEAVRTVAFGGGQDEILAQTLGPSCDKTIALITIRDEEGFPLWSWSAPLAHAFGDVFAAGDSEQAQAFVERWAAVQTSSTGAAPAWAALGEARTTLDQLTYTDIRARDLPMLCHFSGTARETCIFYEPAAGGAGLYLERAVAADAP